jgi:hypothetical protein
MGYVATAIVALMFGFGIGFVFRNVTRRWCPVCGLTVESCADCAEKARGAVRAAAASIPVTSARGRRRLADG